MSLLYKPSKYNFIIPVEEKKTVLLYNSLLGGLYELDENEGKTVEKLTGKNNFSIQDVPDEHRKLLETLIEKKYFSTVDFDEMQVIAKNYYRYRNGNFNQMPLTVTIVPTLSCNLACRYCFQNGAQPALIKKETMLQIRDFLRERLIEIEKAKPVSDGEKKELQVTWFGGEPLIAMRQIEEFTPILKTLFNEFGYDYTADIITNGTLLTQSVWDSLERLSVKRVQVTLDGPALTHNQRRPRKAGGQDNYADILKNLSFLPDGIHLTIRVNTDKIVWDNINQLLDDLEERGIWPQKAGQVNIALAFIAQYDNARYNDVDWYFSAKDFFWVENEFTELKLRRYNAWAAQQGKKAAQKRFNLPTFNLTECATAVNPNGFVFDADGYVNKCWTDTDKPSTRICHVTDHENRNDELLDKWLSFDRLTNKECAECKFLPVCDVRCPRVMIMDKKNKHCDGWVDYLSDILKKQYIDMLDNPGKYAPL